MKLFKKLEYQDVGELVIWGNGRPSSAGDFPLDSLITLLDRPESERDGSWELALSPYVQHLTRMYKHDLNADTLRRGLRLLKVKLTMPHPEAIEHDNMMLLVDVVRKIWGVELTVAVAETTYNALYRKVWNASKKPKQSRIEKRITRAQAMKILREALQKEKILGDTPETILDTQAKLQKGKLQEYLPYALQKRMDARQVKYELELGSSDWQDLKDDISGAWENFQADNPLLSGIRLWTGLRALLKKLGAKWSKEKNNSALGADFAEGVFFDMMGVCEADIGT